MVEDRCVQEMHIQVRCAKGFRVKVLFSMSPSATPAAQSEGRCRQGPHLPRRMHVDVVKCHACHANTRDKQTTQARHQSQPCAISAMPATSSATSARCRQRPATQSEGRCRQVPCLPRKQPRRPKDPGTRPEPAQCHKCHALPRKVKVDVTKRHAYYAK